MYIQEISTKHLQETIAGMFTRENPFHQVFTNTLNPNEMWHKLKSDCIAELKFRETMEVKKRKIH